MFCNRLPERLSDEQEAARRAEVMPVDVPGPAFDALATEGERMIFVVVDGRLVVSRRRAMGENITHAVLADGGPVEAAGEFEVAGECETVVVTALNNMSGHYRPDASSLSMARDAFETRGVPVRPGCLRPYDWGAL